MPDTALTRPEPPAHPLALTAAGSLERHPVAVYLAHLAPGSRRVMRGALDAIALAWYPLGARALVQGRLADADPGPPAGRAGSGAGKVREYLSLLKKACRLVYGLQVGDYLGSP